MGYELTRFISEVNDDLICTICRGVLQSPVWSWHCEHAFCDECINKWLSRESSCPCDRKTLNREHLRPVPRFMKNLLDKLDIKCEFESNGCEQTLKLESFESHTDVCEFNPEKLVKCQHKCGATLKKKDVDQHNCISVLRDAFTKEMEILTEKFITLKFEMNALKNENRQLNMDVNRLRHEMRDNSGLKTQNQSDNCNDKNIQMSESPFVSDSSMNRTEAPNIPPNPYVLLRPLSVPPSVMHETLSQNVNANENDTPIFRFVSENHTLRSELELRIRNNLRLGLRPSHTARRRRNHLRLNAVKRFTDQNGI